jgi:quercetin dioxygenase-like cupin family protein
VRPVLKVDNAFHPIYWSRQTFTFVSADSRALVLDWVGEPGCIVGQHVHLDTVETFYVTEGEMAFRLDGQPLLARAGDTVKVDVGVRHWIRNRTRQNARARVEYSPPSDLVSVFKILGNLSQANQGALINIVKLFYLTDQAGLRPWSTLAPVGVHRGFMAFTRLWGRAAGWENFLRRYLP